MALTEEQRLKVESEAANADVAFDLAFTTMQEMVAGELAVPAIAHTNNELLETLVHILPGMGMYLAMYPYAADQLRMCLTHAFLVGHELGKAGRELYTLPGEAACDDPTHDHYVPPKEEQN